MTQHPIYLRYLYTVLLPLILCSDITFAQDSKSPTKDTLCAQLKTPIYSQMSKEVYRATIDNLSSCPSKGDRMLADLWRNPSPPDIGYLQAASRRSPSDAVLTEVSRIIHDAKLPLATRIEAAQVMMGYALPTFGEVKLKSHTSAQKDVPAELMRIDVPTRRHWVQVSFTSHPHSNARLPGSRERILREFKAVVESEPESKFGKVVEVLIYWLHRRSAVN